jgi:hypothetical protein
MSNIPRFSAVAFAAVSIGLGVYVVSLRSELGTLRRALDEARVARDTAQKNEEVARGRVAPLQENVARLTAERDGLRGSPGAAAPAAAVTKPGAENPLGAFAQTFATPEMRQMVRKEALKDARKGFADLIKKWNLSAADADQFLEFIADRDSADASDAMSMLAGGKLDEKAIAEQEKRQEKAKEESNTHLKALLGEQRYAEFEAANARREELNAVSAYRDHLESAGTPLSDEQRSTLAKIVKAEKPDENDWKAEDVDFFTKGMTDEQIGKIRQRQEAAQARIAQQAASFLSPDQVNALQAAFRTENEEQDMALKLARNLFQAAPAPAPPR